MQLHTLHPLYTLHTFHESWNFPAGVSFALKQNMYWGGFCAFLPDISGLGGGGGEGWTVPDHATSRVCKYCKHLY